MLSAKELTVIRDGRKVLEGATLSVDPKAITVIVGPNGSGKSTLLRCLAGAVRPDAGAAMLDGRPTSRWPVRDFARRVAFLPQAPQAPEGLTLAQLVAHGRFAHGGLWSGPRDRAAVAEALDQTGLAPLATRAFATLSGGERQRGWIAMALAQQSAMLLLDEPTTWLDLGHQAEVLALLRRLNREWGLGIAMVLHDMNYAAALADRMVALKDGRIVADGPPDSVLTPALLHRLFGVRAVVMDMEGTPHFAIRGGADA